MDELTPDQLEAILGTDYETVLADALRRKGSADDRRHVKNPVGQVGDGNVFFDPAGILTNVMDRRRAGKDMQAAQGDLDKALADQKTGRRTFAQALAPKVPPQSMPMGAPRSVDSTIPGQLPQAPQQPPAPPVPGAPPMAPGAHPALANASTMPPSRLAAAGVPAHVQVLLAKLRGR
jgi:hypothetical protein